jgi:hypothetical protein
MTITSIPPPLNHPVIGTNGMVTVPWASYFRALTVYVQNGGYMLQSTYDPAASGVVDNSDALNGQPGSYYLDLGNATGSLAVGNIEWNIVSATANVTAEAGDFVDVDATSAAVTVTIPNAAANLGKSICVRKSDASGNSVTMSGAINGATSQTISVQYTAIVIASNGSEWCII